MSNGIQLFTDGEGLAVIGAAPDVERFLLDQGLDRMEPKVLDVRRLGSLLGGGSAAVQTGSELAANSGRWVKLTAESAEAVKRFGLMPSKTRGVDHAMIGKPGEVQRWLQIAKAPGALLTGPLALSALATMMQQQAMQQQMDQIVEYLQEINEKVEDILRAQKDAVLADMIGVDLIIEEAFTVREQVGRVSDVTWSKVQATSMAIARTQGYALRQLDAIAEKLQKKTTDLGGLAKETKAAEPRVREWLTVLARTFQLQDAASVLELDRMLDDSPADLERHRLGLAAARRKRLDLVARSTARILEQMTRTVGMANSKVLFNPFDSPAAAASSVQVASGVVDFRRMLGIETEHESAVLKRWRQAAGEAVQKAAAAGSESAAAVKRFGGQGFDKATGVFRAVDIDGDGVPDQPRAAAAVQQAGEALRGAAGSVGGAIGGLFRRKSDDAPSIEEHREGESVDGS